MHSEAQAEPSWPEDASRHREPKFECAKPWAFFSQIVGRENQKRRRRGRGGGGAGTCAVSISAGKGGGGLNIFFRGRNAHQVLGTPRVLVGHSHIGQRKKPININIVGGAGRCLGQIGTVPGTNGTLSRDKLGPVPGTNRPSSV